MSLMASEITSDCLLNRLVRRRSKTTSKLHVTGLCEGNSQVAGEFPVQRASIAENASIWWHHQYTHGLAITHTHVHQHVVMNMPTASKIVKNCNMQGQTLLFGVNICDEQGKTLGFDEKNSNVQSVRYRGTDKNIMHTIGCSWLCFPLLFFWFLSILTHWDRVTHICVSYYVICRPLHPYDIMGCNHLSMP